MPFTIPNYNDAAYGDQAEPDSIDFNILSTGLAGNGVVSGCAVTAQGTPNMTVAVASGTVIADATIASVSSGNVTISAADSTNPRFDLITVNSSGTKAVVAGTAASNAVFPSPASTVIVLAAIYVPAAATTITTGQIVDKRVFIPSNVARRYATDIGNGALTTFTITHGLGSKDVIVQLFDNSTGAQIEADVIHSASSPYNLTINFASAPSSNAYRVVVLG